MPDKKYFSYVRVSTQRQGQAGTSLDEQQAAIEHFARNWNLTIAKRFEERETAAKQGRPVFLDMLKQLKAQKADGVIIHKIDRSARNLKDWADLGTLIDNGLEVHFASESLDLSSRGGRLSADIQAVVASDFIRNLREETKKGMYGRLKQGLFPFRAPIGYLDRGKGKPKEIDPTTSQFIRMAFTMYASGEWGLHALTDHLNVQGLRNRAGGQLTVNGVSTLLHNAFYTGVIRIRKTGDTFTGIHEPLISPHLYKRVQDVFAGKNIRKSFSHSFVFRRLIKCAKCSNVLIAERKKGVYVYYRCHTRNCTRGCLKEESITKAVALELEKIKFRDVEYQLLKRLAIQSKKDWKHHSQVQQNAVELRQRQLKGRQSRLVDAYMDGVLDKETYLTKKAEFAFEEQDLTSRLQTLDDRSDRAKLELGQFLELANSASLSFKLAPPELKRELVKAVTSNLTAMGKSVIVKLEKPFEILAIRQPFPNGSPERETDRTTLAKISEIISKDEKWQKMPRTIAPTEVTPPQNSAKSEH